MLALAALLLVSWAVLAQEARPFVRGSQQAIMSSHQGRPFILALWSLDCTHCIDDLVVLGKLQARHRDLAVVLVATDTPAQRGKIESTLRQYRLQRAESWVFADSFAERLRFEVDPQWYGELPRTYFFDAAGGANAVSGRLERGEIERWIRGNERHD